MADNNLNIPESVKQKYPELVALILETKSMDDDERQYWFNILPIMKDEQVQKLRDILDNEKTKIAEIDSQYSNVDSKPSSNFDREAYQKNKENLREQESLHEKAEEQEEADLLEQIQGF